LENKSLAGTLEQEFESVSSVLREMVNSLTDLVCQADGSTVFIPCKPTHQPAVVCNKACTPCIN